MDIQKFKKTYTQLVSESNQEAKEQLKKYIRSIVEEVLNESFKIPNLNNHFELDSGKLSVTYNKPTRDDKQGSYLINHDGKHIGTIRKIELSGNIPEWEYWTPKDTFSHGAGDTSKQAFIEAIEAMLKKNKIKFKKKNAE